MIGESNYNSKTVEYQFPFAMIVNMPQQVIFLFQLLDLETFQRDCHTTNIKM